jgi:signal peptidase I
MPPAPPKRLPTHRRWQGLLSTVGVVALGLSLRVLVIEPYQIPTGSMIPSLQIGDHLYVNKLAYGLRVPLTRTHLMTWADPERGDVIILPAPVAPEERGSLAHMWDTPYIKRVVGLPGDRLRLRDDRLIINGVALDTQAGAKGVSCDESDALAASCDQQREQAGTRAWTSQHYDSWARAERGAMPSWPPRQSPQCPPGVDCGVFGVPEHNPDWPEVIIPEERYLVMGDNRDNSHDGRFWGLIERRDVLGRASFIWWAQDKSRLFQAVHEDPS